MKKTFLSLVIAIFCASFVCAQGYYTKACYDKKLQRSAAAWMKQGDWRNGFTAACPASCTNAVEFYTQYHKNQAQWDAMFKWLSTADLQNLPAGKHPIPGSKLTASIEDSENQPLEKRTSESHYHNIDFQYVVKGYENFGIIDHCTSTPNTIYKPDVIRYAFDTSLTKFYESSIDRFFLFFPCDWHIAKVATQRADQKIRVVVIKLDYVE